MDQSLAYLHEILSNYTEDNEAIRNIDENMLNQSFSSEGDFVRNLHEQDRRMLEQILLKEIHHANQVGDHERGYQLNEVYELLT
ncbi:sporulation protein [Bacillaceae bacterium S4-13-58]